MCLAASGAGMPVLHPLDVQIEETARADVSASTGLYARSYRRNFSALERQPIHLV
jgi:hypothetical protein